MAPLRALVLLAALCLAAPLAAADVPPKQRVCTAYGCAQTDDRDGDGKVDWANVALAAENAVHLNANANRTNASYQGSATAEEYEPLHVDELGGAPGVDAWGYANLTSREGGVGFNDTDANLVLYLLDHETGEVLILAEGTVYAADADRDGLPDRVLARLLV
jgi:hypothetical protein